jgi:peptidoglycan-N-acetylglucosamine deacetylase
MNKPFVTTSWDDGHVLDRRLAAMLSRYELPATFYIAPYNHEISENDRLPAAEVRRLAEQFEIGGHTLTHHRLPTLNHTTATHEIVGGKLLLEKLIRRNLVSFCYPCGAYGQREVDIVARAGFHVARTVRRHRTNPASVPLETHTSVHAYRHLVDGPLLWVRAGLRPQRAYRRWRNWDELAIQQFDDAIRTGGVFHLWGHSWEIDHNGDWKRLERVFEHISQRSDVDYGPNAALATHVGDNT